MLLALLYLIVLTLLALFATMEGSLVDLKRKRGAAKGIITKLTITLKVLLATELSKLRPATLKRHLETLERNSEAFIATHELIFLHEEEKMDEEQYKAELEKHYTIVELTRENLEDLLDKHSAIDTLRLLDESLEPLEACARDGYDLSMNRQLQNVQELYDKFISALARIDCTDYPGLPGIKELSR